MHVQSAGTSAPQPPHPARRGIDASQSGTADNASGRLVLGYFDLSLVSPHDPLTAQKFWNFETRNGVVVWCGVVPVFSLFLTPTHRPPALGRLQGVGEPE